jgi:serine phosphatase RsbU (regulator of sigma subunit)
MDIVRATQSQSAQAMLQTLASAVEAHVDANDPFDDLTIVILKRRAAPAEDL